MKCDAMLCFAAYELGVPLEPLAVPFVRSGSSAVWPTDTGAIVAVGETEELEVCVNYTAE